MPAAQVKSELSDEVIAKALSEVSSTAQRWSEAMTKDQTGDDATAEAAQARTQLIGKVWSLYSAVKGPVDMIHDHLEKFSHTGAVRALLAMGVFDELPADGESRSAQQLSDALGVEKQLLVRLMRIVTAIGPFKEVGKEEYAHTELSRAYLDPGLRGFFAMAVDEHMAVSASFHEYFARNGFKMPTSPNDNPYTHHFQTGGVPVFEWMAKFPSRIENFNVAMTVGSEQGAQSVGLFPWREELSKHRTTPETILVVDVGGGRGHAARLIRDELDGVPGRVVLQDQAAAIQGGLEGALPGAGVEAMAHDFFTPQPTAGGEEEHDDDDDDNNNNNNNNHNKNNTSGALVYFLRRVLHDWSDEAGVRILRNVAGAMSSESRVVINEFLMPEAGADPEACWVDLIMMTFAGTERTAAQFESILDAAGLRLSRIYSSNKTHYVAIEARLKEV